MGTVSFDGQSFVVDGRRVWLVSGAIHYTRTPRELWRRRIRAAREAGLNCVETPVFWNTHEARPGRFSFDADLDLRHFVQLIAEEGMYCILRPGPYVGADWDFGGLPPWLHRLDEVRFRQSQAAFMEACARYLGAVMEQVRDLQVTSPIPGRPKAVYEGNLPGAAGGGFRGNAGGPVILVQAENEWLCHNPEQADAYLREIVRYLRENGCQVPISNCNNLWQRVDGTIDTWNGNRFLGTDLRQLAVVQPHAPRIVTQYQPGSFDQWGRKHNDRIDDDLHLYRMAQILASGAQYNLHVFHGGTNFGFWAGRSVGRASCFRTTSYDSDAPLLEAGGRGPKYLATKAISTFASQFHYVLAHLRPQAPHSALAPTEKDHPLSVIHLNGTQGQLVFLLRSAKDQTRSADLMLPNGLTLPVPLGRGRAAWLLLDANLGGVATLNYTNLRPWAFLQKKLLVLFGPAGATGLVCVDDVQHQVKVPTGHEPTVWEHDPLTLVVLNERQLDAAYLFEGGVAIGACGLDDEGHPQSLRGWPVMFMVSADGRLTRCSTEMRPQPGAPTLGGWTHLPLGDMVTGAAEQFQPLDGPASLEQLKCDYGYGWYKIRFTKGRRGLMLAPWYGDRLHVYTDGRLQAIMGHGPGATLDPLVLRLHGDVVFLADNLGRHSFGQDLGEQKGLFDHIYAVKRIRLGTPRIVSQQAPNPFELTGFVFHRHRGERAEVEAYAWTIKPTSRRPLILEIKDLPVEGVLTVNGVPVGLYAGEHSAGVSRYMLRPGDGTMTRGRNEIRLVLYGPRDRKLDVRKFIHLYQTTDAVTAHGRWSFGRWTVPDPERFTALPSTLPPQPAWFRCRFETKHTELPLWLEPKGMSKGQIYLNGHNVGRYFMATFGISGHAKVVPPQRFYYLPEPWLNTTEPNELLIFDEHGKKPENCRLVYNERGPYN